MSSYPDALTRVIEQVVRPRAGDVDRHGQFPTEAVAELGRAGILGLTSAAGVGGGGEGLRAAAEVIEALAGICGSTAMVVLMHFAATAVIESCGPEAVRHEIAAGRHLTTLAFSEAGSRSHFWAPLGRAVDDGVGVILAARKSWVTSAAAADSYVWSSLPLGDTGPMTLWLVPKQSAGLSHPGVFDGLGLRGNGSVPVHADDVAVARTARLGEDGAGLDIALSTALPWFLVLSGAFAVGLMEAVTAETGRHLTATRLDHLGQALIDQPIARADYARMRLTTDTTRVLVADTVAALESARPDATLRVLEVKAVGAEAAIEVSDLAMKLCGGAAFRRELGVERRFRDALAARVMAPTTDALLDFVGRAIAGLPLFER